LENSRRQELNQRLTILEAFVSELKQAEKKCNTKYKDCQSHYKECKKSLEYYRDERGKPEASIIVKIEQLLEKFDASRAAYYGGRF
jgi:hypothetical protein